MLFIQRHDIHSYDNCSNVMYRQQINRLLVLERMQAGIKFMTKLPDEIKDLLMDYQWIFTL